MIYDFYLSETLGAAGIVLADTLIRAFGHRTTSTVAQARFIITDHHDLVDKHGLVELEDYTPRADTDMSFEAECIRYATRVPDASPASRTLGRASGGRKLFTLGWLLDSLRRRRGLMAPHHAASQKWRIKLVVPDEILPTLPLPDTRIENPRQVVALILARARAIRSEGRPPSFALASSDQRPTRALEEPPLSFLDTPAAASDPLAALRARFITFIPATQ